MSQDALSPEQFGFLPVHPWEEQEKISESLNRQEWPQKMISLSHPPLRANHPIHPEAVDYYVKKPRGNFTGDPDRNPTVIKHKGEHVILSGHHRIAAALRRGQKKMKVDYGESDEPSTP
jgi:hypothetical protein